MSNGGVHQPLERYGIIGNLETCALICATGSIDWWCVPTLGAESVFARLLDADSGGCCLVQPTASFDATQSYRGRTNVLDTTFRTADAKGTVTDFMPVAGRTDAGPTAIYRRLSCDRGPLELSIEIMPRFDYARATVSMQPTSGGVIARADETDLFVRTEYGLTIESAADGSDMATGTITIAPGETSWLVLQYNRRDPLPNAACESELGATLDFWRSWSHECTHPNRCLFAGPHHEMAVRSTLALKLLSNWRTGALAAAATTSIPEVVGGTRNWDYRFSWIRDSAFTIQALYELGHVREARRVYDRCLAQCHATEKTRNSQPLFGLTEREETTERTLEHFSGYRGSTPVRIGNAASTQLQHDMYGELLLSIHRAYRYGEPISEATWEMIRGVVDRVCSVWEQPDHGIWEIRTAPRQYVHSKVLCWAAIDRGIKIAADGGFDAPIDRWVRTRDRIHTTVIDRGFDADRNSFVQSFDDSSRLDAATLRIPLVGFLDATDGRVVGTINAIERSLTTEEGLVYRYRGGDGIETTDHPFIVCTFWLVDCLVLRGEIERARQLYETVLDHASPLGLFAEEIDPESGELRGNLPLALSHVGLINSALYLRYADGEAGIQPPGV
ncbi:glycoside hydrolase family 15 protein [Halocatena halophila]|uniref:glycoside hydrolase family 15 protein n=1 Tax=Halocatena halophila TaxID=2814576 RepID=UPI002ED18D13